MIKKLKSKKVIIVSIMILLTSVLSLSYASFVVTTNDYKASELLVSELSYSLTIYEEGRNTPLNGNIKISPNTTKIYNVVLEFNVIVPTEYPPFPGASESFVPFSVAPSAPPNFKFISSSWQVYLLN